MQDLNKIKPLLNPISINLARINLTNPKVKSESQKKKKKSILRTTESDTKNTFKTFFIPIKNYRKKSKNLI